MDSFQEANMLNAKRWPVCNNNPESAPHFHGKCFLLCWRCTGGLVGACFWYGIYTALSVNLSEDILVLLWMLFVPPAVIDYFLIRLKYIAPSNFRRFITGCLLGVPISAAVIWCINIVLG